MRREVEAYRVETSRLVRIVARQQSCIGDCNEDIVSMAAEVLALREAAEPFVKLARQRYPKEGGASSFIDIMTNYGAQDELELRSLTAASDRIEIIDASDFRRLLEVVARGERP